MMVKTVVTYDARSNTISADGGSPQHLVNDLLAFSPGQVRKTRVIHA